MTKFAILFRIILFLLFTCVSSAFAQSVTITPSAPSVGLGSSVQLSAVVTGLSSNAVAWTVVGPASGTITSGGLYTAPAAMPGQVPVAITATSTVNTSISSTAYVTLLTTGPSITSVTPNPLLVGTINVTVQGSGFQSGATVVDTSNGAAVQMSTTSLTSDTIVANGYQPSAASASFTVVNPGSTPSNAIVVPITGGFSLNVINGTGSGNYAAGAVVAIQANPPAANQTFLDWTGANVASATSAGTTLVMPSADVTVTANYSGSFKLTVVNGTGSGTYKNGSTIAISANPPSAGQWFSKWTGATTKSPAYASTSLVMPGADATVTATYYTPPVIPYPVSTHPRLWVTPADLPRLQSWASASNPIYQKGMAPLLQQAVNIYQTQFFPGGVANPNYPDPGDTQGYTGYLTEQYGAVLAFNSLIDPDPNKRIEYAQYTRNLLMYAMNEAAQGIAAGLPFRDPAFATYNRANGSGEQWPLMVDWIYNAVDGQGKAILSASDKATIRNVFLMWSNSCINASTAYGDHPVPIGTVKSTTLLPAGEPYRMASNNYYLGHARLLTMMALSIDPLDDPSLNSQKPPSYLGNTLRSYILNANGAWLYQEYAMMGEPSQVTQAYGFGPSRGGYGLANGGLPPEGMLYGHSYGFILGQLLALQTAGFNNPAYSGPQIGLIGAPVWDRFVQGYISSLTPTAKTFAADSYLGPLFQFASYGDVLRLWVTPDGMEPFSLLALLEQENGLTTHASAATWFSVNATEGGAGALMNRITDPWSYSSTASILYYLLLAPGYDASNDPRSGYPPIFVDQGAGRLIAHNGSGATATMFDFRASWESINHQQGDAGSFELLRNGEWLTKEMSNYDNNLVGFTPTYLNSLSIKNWCPSGTPNLSWDEVGEWANGGQWILAASAGDPYNRFSSGTGYVYADSDLTKLYNRPDVWDDSLAANDVVQATRSAVWLNNDYIVVYDRATTNHSGLFKQFTLSLVNQPTINGNVATETLASGQQLFVQTVLPLGASVTTYNGAVELSPVAQLEPTQFVLTIEDPKLPADTRFLHVLQGANKGAPMNPAIRVRTTSGIGFDGAAFGSMAVFFPMNRSFAFRTTAFSVPAGVHTMVIAGLVPNTSYQFSVATGGSNNSVTVTAASGGVETDSAGLLKLAY